MINEPLGPTDKTWFGAYKILDLSAVGLLLLGALRFWLFETPVNENIPATIGSSLLLAICMLDIWMLHFHKKFFISAYVMPLAMLGVIFMAIWFVHQASALWLAPAMILLFMRLPFRVAQILSGLAIAIALAILKWHRHADFDFLSRAAVAFSFSLLGLNLLFKINWQAIQKLNETTDLLNNALQAMSQGICVVGRDGRFKMFNDKLCGILDLPKALLESKPLLSEIVQIQRDRGDFGEEHANIQESARQYVRSMGLDPSVFTPPRYVRVDRNGRHIEIQTQDMPMGEVVRTYTDVTDYALMNKQLQVAIAQKEALSLRVLAETREKMVATLTQLALIRDNETGLHIQRTQLYCRALAEALVENDCYTQELTAKHIDLIVLAAPMHDLGKVGIPDHILLKPGRHTSEESIIMRTHALLGETILRVAAEENNASDSLFFIAANIAGGHHENWDGSGYPRALSGCAIPLEARLMSLADVYDALTSVRVYKANWTHEQAMTEIIALSGVKFDPVIVDAFKLKAEKFREIARELADANAAGQ